MSAHAPALAKPTTPAAPAPALDDGAPLSTTISLSAGGSAAAAATDPECALPAQEEAGAGAGGVKVAGSLSESMDEQCDHVHYSHRAPWLRAFVLGANDGLVSVAALMMGIGGGVDDLATMRLAGIAAWIAGALSMAVGEYISVASQRDCEEADIAKERAAQAKGPDMQARELAELTAIYERRGLCPHLAAQVARALTDKDVIRAHARDELGIDLDQLANPLQASVVSAVAFTCGAALPLLAGAFIHAATQRLISVALVTTAGLALFGLLGSALGGARLLVGAARVLVGGWIAMAITFGIGKALSKGAVA